MDQKLRKKRSDVEGNTKTSTSDSKTKIQKFRNWFVTVNNYTDKDIENLKTHKCRYIAWQKEVGKKCGTPHFHACIVYDSQRVWPIKVWPTAHIEVAKDLPKCILYCTKEKTRVEGPFEQGDKPNQGKRSDLTKIAQDVIEGKKLSEIAIEAPDMFVKYSRGLKLLREETQVHRNSDKAQKVMYLWGLAGVGKTRIPTTLFKNDVYIKDGTMWWDNYDHEKCVLIDDFDGKWPFRDLLRLLDRNAYQGQFKGGYVKINSDYIFITCEFPPEHFWENNELAQVTRRITKIVNVLDYETALNEITSNL